MTVLSLHTIATKENMYTFFFFFFVNKIIIHSSSYNTIAFISERTYYKIIQNFIRLKLS
jgi:hypothetical protein